MKELPRITYRSILTSNQSGFVLVMVLVFMVSMTLFGIMALNNSRMEITNSANEKFQSNAFYQSDAGAETNIALLEQNIDYKGFDPNELANDVGDVWIHPASASFYMELLTEKMPLHQASRNAAIANGLSLDPLLLTPLSIDGTDDDKDTINDDDDELGMPGLTAFRVDQNLVTPGATAAGTLTNVQGAFRDAYSPKNQTPFNSATPGLQTTSMLIYEDLTYLATGGDLESNMGYHIRGVNKGGGAEIAYTFRSHSEHLAQSRSQIATQWIHVIK